VSLEYREVYVGYGQEYQALGGRRGVHDSLVQELDGRLRAYADDEATAASALQSVLSPIRAKIPGAAGGVRLDFTGAINKQTRDC